MKECVECVYGVCENVCEVHVKGIYMCVRYAREGVCDTCVCVKVCGGVRVCVRYASVVCVCKGVDAQECM